MELNLSIERIATNDGIRNNPRITYQLITRYQITSFRYNSSYVYLNTNELFDIYLKVLKGINKKEDEKIFEFEMPQRTRRFLWMQESHCEKLVKFPICDNSDVFHIIEYLLLKKKYQKIDCVFQFEFGEWKTKFIKYDL